MHTLALFLHSALPYGLQISAFEVGIGDCRVWVGFAEDTLPLSRRERFLEPHMIGGRDAQDFQKDKDLQHSAGAEERLSSKSAFNRVIFIEAMQSTHSMLADTACILDGIRTITRCARCYSHGVYVPSRAEHLEHLPAKHRRCRGRGRCGGVSTDRLAMQKKHALVQNSFDALQGLSCCHKESAFFLGSPKALLSRAGRSHLS